MLYLFYMRTIPLFIAAIALCAAFSAPDAKAASISAGDLIKASGPAVYYYSANGKRYVFPTEKTYKTWYADFLAVKTITDSELSALTIGGNVTYKPGVKLIKITTDPRTYAVSTGGTLRQLATEQIAASLYGADWNTKVDDLPDAFFVNYKIGSIINLASDFSSSQATALATSIDADKQAVVPTVPCTTCTVTPPVTTSTPPVVTSNVTLIVTKTTVRPGDTETLQATAVGAIKEIRLYFDNTLVQTCTNANQCNTDVAVPIISDKSAYEARAIAITSNDTQYTTTLNVPVDNTSISDKVFTTADHTTVKSGQSVGITVSAPNVVVKRIDVYIDGLDAVVCESGIRICLWSQTFTGVLGATHTAYSIVQDTIGRTYRSNTLIITIATNDSPVVTVTPGKPVIYVGETVDVTVSATDPDGIKFIEVLDANKNLLKRCDSAAPCTYITPAQTQKGIVTFYGRATDLMDGTDIQSTSITVQ